MTAHHGPIVRTVWLGAVVLGAEAASATLSGAQDRAATDQSVAASLMAVGLPSPAGPVWVSRDSALKASATRFDVGWGRAGGESASGPHETLTLGIRGEGVEHDLGAAGGVAGYGGIRAGIASRDGALHTLSAFELYAGARSYGFSGKPWLPDFGMDVAIGRGGYGSSGGSRSSLGVRFPIEFVAHAGGVRLTAFGAPSIAWGTIHPVACEKVDENGNPDCTWLFDTNLAFGRPRHLMAGGVSIAAERIGLALSAGVQHLSAPGEAGRYWIGTSWTP
jgi:hypothetical protein